MMRKPRAYRPDATPLESRLVMSLTASPLHGISDPAEIRLLASTAASRPVNRIEGQYFAPEDMRAADGPLNVKMMGAGRVLGMGRARLAGSLLMGGFRADGHDISGTMTLTNAKGSVTLELHGSGGNGQVPGRRFILTASVTEGTGAYTSFRRIGSATVHFGQDSVMSKSSGSNSAIGGGLRIKLDFRPPMR